MTKLGVVGGGSLGTAIALTAIRRGIDVRIHDHDADARSRADARLRRELQKLVDRKILSEDQRADGLSRLNLAGSLDDLAECDIVVEAVVDSVAKKRAIIAQLAAAVSRETVLATTTSAHSITAIANAASRPDQVVGMHFCHPPASSKLIEIVPGMLTSPQSVDRAFNFARELGRTAIRVMNRPGFLVERITRPYFCEAFRLLEDRTATFAAVDEIMRGLGFKMGPFELLDYVGIDSNLNANIALYEATFGEPRYRPHPIQSEYVSAGHLGRKSGRGFYDYREE